CAYAGAASKVITENTTKKNRVATWKEYLMGVSFKELVSFLCWTTWEATVFLNASDILQPSRSVMSTFIPKNLKKVPRSLLQIQNSGLVLFSFLEDRLGGVGLLTQEPVDSLAAI